METSIRQLKANLSAYIRKAAAGKAVTVSVHNRPVARIVPFKVGAPRSQLVALPGVQWNGGKPAGLPKGETLRKGVSLSAWVKQDRR
jgi:prevent-host-death family protein